MLLQERLPDPRAKPGTETVANLSLAVISTPLRFPQCPVCQRAVDIGQGYADKALQAGSVQLLHFLSALPVSGAVPPVLGGPAAAAASHHPVAAVLFRSCWQRCTRAGSDPKRTGAHGQIQRQF